MDDIYKNMDEHKPNKKREILIFDKATCQKYKGRYFSCFYNTILFCCTKNDWAKFYTLLYNKNSK